MRKKKITTIGKISKDLSMNIKNLILKTLGGSEDNIWVKFIYWNFAQGSQLRNYIHNIRPHRLMEIGVLRGGSAEKMIEAVKRW